MSRRFALECGVDGQERWSPARRNMRRAFFARKTLFIWITADVVFTIEGFWRLSPSWLSPPLPSDVPFSASSGVTLATDADAAVVILSFLMVHFVATNYVIPFVSRPKKVFRSRSTPFSNFGEKEKNVLLGAFLPKLEFLLNSVCYLVLQTKKFV
mmetsp:Transcript_42660/g.100052  ORF Transcript_42660/g.100052 Transcript_42660/m.100052 type:complete len:155 (+) Transcript_42660:1624-2088(+)